MMMMPLLSLSCLSLQLSHTANLSGFGYTKSKDAPSLINAQYTDI
jgi:hypothetical protein